MSSVPLELLSACFADVRSETESLFAEQWADPELPGLEYRSAARLLDFLERHGFAVTPEVGGVPTAIEARLKTGEGPVIAFLAEYDALPGLSAEAATSFRPGKTMAGHGCGHNHIGPANSAAGILAAKTAAALGLRGEIRVIGCPAEELLWGKIALLHAGVFDGIDIILTSHGDYQTGALSRPCQSVVSGEFVFHGEAGHGGFASTQNALLAAEAFVGSAERLCAAEFPDVQLRHVLRRAGIMPGITPDEARVWYTARHVRFERAQEAYAAIAALVPGARHQFISETRGYLPNDVLGRHLFACMSEIGPPKWSASDLWFMENLCGAVTPDRAMNLDRNTRYFDTGEDYYGQDDGDVSWRVPLGRVNWAYPENVPIHHWAWTALSGSSASSAGPLLATQALALAALGLMAEPSLVAAAKSELVHRTGGTVPPLPRLGAVETLKHRPQTFWDASWTE